jgi:Na+(H+)/acetate symporter ActP
MLKPLQKMEETERLNPHCPKQTSPITPDIILEFYKKLDVTEACDATFWCLFLHAFFLMSRKSNIIVHIMLKPLQKIEETEIQNKNKT